jgi:hypothetical protein
MAGRYRLAMDFFSDNHQAPSPLWAAVDKPGQPLSGSPVTAEPVTDLDDTNAQRAELIRLRARVAELEASVADYESLLAELPDLFERKFQQRLEPLLERYRLLAQTQQMLEPAHKAPLQRAALRWNWPLVRRLGTQDDQEPTKKAA